MHFIVEKCEIRRKGNKGYMFTEEENALSHDFVLLLPTFDK